MHGRAGAGGKTGAPVRMGTGVGESSVACSEDDCAWGMRQPQPCACATCACAKAAHARAVLPSCRLRSTRHHETLLRPAAASLQAVHTVLCRGLRRPPGEGAHAARARHLPAAAHQCACAPAGAGSPRLLSNAFFLKQTRSGSARPRSRAPHRRAARRRVRRRRRRLADRRLGNRRLARLDRQ